MAEPDDAGPASFAELVGADIEAHLRRLAPAKVLSRVDKAEHHFVRALALAGIDDEMGAIRLIAAEEELVVAIFELVKLRSDRMPEHRDFVRRFRNHYVKLAFYPVLHEFRSIVLPWLEGEMETDGGVALPVAFEIDRSTLQVVMTLQGTGAKLPNNPLFAMVSLDDLSDEEVVTRIFDQLEARVLAHGYPSLRAFVTARAEYRNDLLYAQDGGHMAMGETLADILATFRPICRDLLWALAILLANDAPGERWGLVSQFFAVYRRVLDAVGIRLGPPLIQAAGAGA